MVRMLAGLIWLAILGYIGFCATLFVLQDRMVWVPGSAPLTDPSIAGLAFRELSLETRDGERLHAWYVEGGPKVVLISHGNAGSIEDRIGLLAALNAMGLGALVYDYRGFGRSTGRPSEEGTYLDAEAAYDALTGDLGISPKDVVLYGESLGGAVAVELALRRPVGHLIVENTFTSLPDVAAGIYPWLPVRWLARIRYDSDSKIGGVGVPVMVIHSPQDELIPFAHGERLYTAANDPKQFLATRGGHNDGGFRNDANDRAAVLAFLEGP